MRGGRQLRPLHLHDRHQHGLGRYTLLLAWLLCNQSTCSVDLNTTRLVLAARSRARHIRNAQTAAGFLVCRGGTIAKKTHAQTLKETQQSHEMMGGGWGYRSQMYACVPGPGMQVSSQLMRPRLWCTPSSVWVVRSHFDTTYLTWTDHKLLSPVLSSQCSILRHSFCLLWRHLCVTMNVLSILIAVYHCKFLSRDYTTTDVRHKIVWKEQSYQVYMEGFLFFGICKMSCKKEPC